MGEFFLFVLIIFAFGWGSAFLLPFVRRHSSRMEPTIDHEVLARLMEDMDQISGRLTQVEEELDFFRELRAPGEPERLPPPDGDSHDS